MVLSIYDNTQIPSIGTDLLRIRFGIFAGAADEPGGGCNYRVSFCGGFGDTRPENCLGGDRPQYQRFVWGMTIVNTVNLTA